MSELAEDFAPLSESASVMTAYEFAFNYDGRMRFWGSPIQMYIAVNVFGTDYLWRIRDGQYDGWNKSVPEVEVH